MDDVIEAGIQEGMQEGMEKGIEDALKAAGKEEMIDDVLASLKEEGINFEEGKKSKKKQVVRRYKYNAC